MPIPRVILAGPSFPAIREYLARAISPVSIEVTDVDHLRRCGGAAEVLIPMMSRIDASLMDAVRDLRLIQQWGAGLEGVDISAASSRGIAVANVPTAESGNAESVAEWCVMAALALSRQLPRAYAMMRAGASWGAPCGQAMLGRTAGIVGLGGIGQALATRLKPFGLRLLALQRTPQIMLKERLGLEWIGSFDQLSELLRQVDYLFLCLPLTEQTRRMIDRSAITLMPRGSYIINAARGPLLDESALLDQLDNGHLGGAALDVYAQEPLDTSSRLLGRDDIVTTPHIAGVTDLSYRGISTVVGENIGRVMRSAPLLNCRNVDRIRTTPV